MSDELYDGTVTTTGNSTAFRMDKAFFKAHPEFEQQAKVKAKPVGPGAVLLLLSESPESSAVDVEADPVFGAFLSFLERDMARHPERIHPLSDSSIARADELTRDVVVSDDEELPDDLDG